MKCHETRSKLLTYCGDDDEHLSLECERFHQLLFHRKPSALFIVRYITAHKHIDGLLSVSEAEHKTLTIIISKKLNAVNIEPWLRNTHKRHILSSKLMLIASLAECDAMHLEFARKTNGLLPAYLCLAWYGFLGALKLIHGKITIKVCGIV